MVLGIRILTWSKAKFVKIRLGVQRNVMNIGPDPCGTQPCKGIAARKAGSLFVPADNVEVPGGRTARIAPGQRKPAIGKQSAVAVGKPRALPNVIVEPPHLAATKRGLNIGHAIIPAKLDYLIVPRAVGFTVHPGRIANRA